MDLFEKQSSNPYAQRPFAPNPTLPSARFNGAGMLNTMGAKGRQAGLTASANDQQIAAQMVALAVAELGIDPQSILSEAGFARALDAAQNAPDSTLSQFDPETALAFLAHQMRSSDGSNLESRPRAAAASNPSGRRAAVRRREQDLQSQTVASQAKLPEAKPDGATQIAQAAAPLSGRAKNQAQGLLQVAKHASRGRRHDGRCYFHVANFLDRVPYGKVGNRQFNSQVPGSHWREARQFAEWANKGNNADRMGLKRLNIDNPYDAPPGAIVVVRAGTPGTAHPTAGDIAVRGEGNAFYNGGEMSYGGRGNFPPGNNYVLGVYMPK
jgi:hypothetical protein